MGELNVYPNEVIEILNLRNDTTILATVRKLKKKENKSYIEPNVLLANFPLINQIGCTIGNMVKIRKIECEFAQSLTVEVLNYDISGLKILGIPFDEYTINKLSKLKENPSVKETAMQIFTGVIMKQLTNTLLRRGDLIHGASSGATYDLKIIDFSPNTEATKCLIRKNSKKLKIGTKLYVPISLKERGMKIYLMNISLSLN